MVYICSMHLVSMAPLSTDPYLVHIVSIVNSAALMAWVSDIPSLYHVASTTIGYLPY